MLRVEKLSLYHFKNYEQREFHFDQRIVGFCGPNGAGKTNLLDALYFLCFTKSYFSRTDAGAAMNGTGGFRIEGSIKKGAEQEICTCVLRETGKKEFSINNNPYNRFSEHIGRYACIVIAPDDASLINGSSDERRRFLDSLLSQLNHTYLENLILYNKILLQRNAVLKTYPQPPHLNDMLDIYDAQLAPAAAHIIEVRQSFLKSYAREVVSVYEEISGGKEHITLAYLPSIPPLANPLLALKQNRYKDVQSQRSTLGPHKDEIDMQFDNGNSFKWVASQGQKKSMLFALKLAAYNTLRDNKGYSPLLLLDDVFEKLDDERVQNLLQNVCAGDGQVFITDTDPRRLEKKVADAGLNIQLVEF